MGAVWTSLRGDCGGGTADGPTLAAQFGFAPGFLWLLIGAVLCGCVQDFTVLVASVRHRGRSVADVARTEISPFAGLVAMIAVLFILLVTLAGLGIVVVNALSNSPWGVFTIGMTIPIAVIMGWWMFKSHAGKITVTGPSIFGVVLLIAGVVAGPLGGADSVGRSSYFYSASDHDSDGHLRAGGVGSSRLARTGTTRLSFNLRKLGTIAVWLIGVFVVHPNMPVFRISRPFVHGVWTNHQREFVSISFL